MATMTVSEWLDAEMRKPGYAQSVDYSLVNALSLFAEDADFIVMYHLAGDPDDDMIRTEYNNRIEGMRWKINHLREVLYSRPTIDSDDGCQTR